jgi:hypothetical protein
MFLDWEWPAGHVAMERVRWAFRMPVHFWKTRQIRADVRAKLNGCKPKEPSHRCIGRAVFPFTMTTLNN